MRFQISSRAKGTKLKHMRRAPAQQRGPRPVPSCQENAKGTSREAIISRTDGMKHNRAHVSSTHNPSEPMRSYEHTATHVSGGCVLSDDALTPILEVTSVSDNVSINLPSSLRGKGFYAESANRVYVGSHYFMIHMAKTTMILWPVVYPLLLIVLLHPHAKALTLTPAHHEFSTRVGGVWDTRDNGPVLLGGTVTVADAGVVADIEEQAAAANAAQRKTSVRPRLRRFRRLAGRVGKVVGPLAAGCLAVKGVLRV